MEADPVQADPPVRTDPPYVPIRTSPWPQRRIPRSTYLVGVALLLIAVAVGVVHKPSQAEKASDFRGFLQEVTSDIESCAGGVSESLQALRLVQSGADASAADVSAGISVAQQGAANCSPANNEQIDDLQSVQVSESLDSYRLSGAVTGLVNWAAPDAEQVQTDVANVLSARGGKARSQAEAQLAAARTALDKQRSAVNATIDAAMRSLDVHQPRLQLPG
jgi:hypothetical protein